MEARRATLRPKIGVNRARSRSLAGEEQQEEMGLHERLLEERAEEERCRGRPLGTFYGLDSPVLDRRLLADAPKDRSPRYRADLYALHRYANEGVRGQGDAYRFHGLKARYREE